MEHGISKNAIISELTRSPHGDLKSYLPIGRTAVAEDPEFFAHLIAWNEKNGTIRDSKVALPVISLAKDGFLFYENSLAHMASLDPRNFVRALEFAKDIKTPGFGKQINALVGEYLRAREQVEGWWDRTALGHKASLKTLYARFHVKPDTRADAILFKGKRPRGSVFEAVANLKNMNDMEAAGTIISKRLPFLVVQGALGKKANSPELVMAMIQSMTPTELVTNSRTLEAMGVMNNPVLRATYESALSAVAKSGKKQVLKTTVAAVAVKSTVMRAKLEGAQEKQIEAGTKVKGDWLVIGDKSGSMATAIETARQVAGILARTVEGKVHLVFVDTVPRYIDATGKTYDEILAITKTVSAGGGTNLGCGLQYLLDKMIAVDGIAVVSDGGEHSSTPFATVYKKYCAKMGNDAPVYLYLCKGAPNYFAQGMASERIDFQTFDMRLGIDYHSLPNVVQTMRASRYALVDDIMNTPLMTLAEAFQFKGETHAAAIAA